MQVRSTIFLLLALILCLGLTPARADEDDARDASDYMLPDTAKRQQQKIQPMPELLKKGESGDIRAQNRLGERYLKGIEVPQHFGKARYWYQRAANQGSPKAMLEVAELYELGKGGPQDLEKAYFWYSLAAAHGVKQAVPRRERLLGRLDRQVVERVQDKAADWKAKPEHGAKP